ncbi:MAG: hypothetical protein ABJZ55_04805 [Fuerstiella sp.]
MMKNKSKILLPALLLVAISGCSSMFDSVINCEMAIRNKVLSQKAWGHWSWCYENLDYPYHFAKGFKAGYTDVLDGGSGCQPTLPPQCYWKPAYQSPEGRSKTNSWFDGFSHGALAAEQDGYGDLGEIPISPTARANIQSAQQRPTPQTYTDGFATGQPLAPITLPPSMNDETLEAVPMLPDGDFDLPAPPIGNPTQAPPVRPYE